jgi:hypothetical protein
MSKKRRRSSSSNDVELEDIFAFGGDNEKSPPKVLRAQQSLKTTRKSVEVVADSPEGCMTGEEIQDLEDIFCIPNSPEEDDAEQEVVAAPTAVRKTYGRKVSGVQNTYSTLMIPLEKKKSSPEEPLVHGRALKKRSNRKTKPRIAQQKLPSGIELAKMLQFAHDDQFELQVE